MDYFLHTYDLLRNFFDEIGPFVGVAPYVVWVFSWIFITAKFWLHPKKPENSDKSSGEDTRRISEIESSSPPSGNEYGDRLPRRVTSEVARVITWRPGTDARFVGHGMQITLSIVIFLPTIVGFSVFSEIQFNFWWLLFVMLAVYTLNKYLISPNSDLFFLDTRLRYGLQISVRGDICNVVSWDFTERYLPEPTPSLRVSSQSRLKILELHGKGIGASRVSLRLFTKEGWIDIISIPLWLFRGKRKEQILAFTAEVNIALESLN